MEVVPSSGRRLARLELTNAVRLIGEVDAIRAVHKLFAEVRECGCEVVGNVSGCLVGQTIACNATKSKCRDSKKREDW